MVAVVRHRARCRGADVSRRAWLRDLSSGYLCGFNDLHIKAVLLDEVMKSPEHADKDMVLDYETRSLRDARHILAKNGIEDAFSYIETNPHPVRAPPCAGHRIVWVVSRVRLAGAGPGSVCGGCLPRRRWKSWTSTLPTRRS